MKEQAYLEILEFLVDDTDHIKAMSVVDRVNQNIAVDSDGIFRGEQRVLVLASCIDDGDVVIGSFEANLFVISLLDSRIVRLDELALYKLYNEGRFACRECVRDVTLVEFSAQSRRNLPTALMPRTQILRLSMRSPDPVWAMLKRAWILGTTSSARGSSAQRIADTGADAPDG
jgi:hypothetical protein